MLDESKYNELLFGFSHEEGLVAFDVSDKEDKSFIKVYKRNAGKIETTSKPFSPWIITATGITKGCPVPCDIRKLNGTGQLNELVLFKNWAGCKKAIEWLAKTTEHSASDPAAPFCFISDPVQQFLMITGNTSFKGMKFEDLKRLQIDIECQTSEGYEFCNPERDDDSIIVIGMADSSGWTGVLSITDMTEKTMLQQFVEIIRERDPDVIEGHNIFNFDLPYLRIRAEKHGVKLTLGRDGTEPAIRSSRFNIGDRTISYERYDIAGRNVIDTLFLVHAYDISHRTLPGFGLKEVAVHFGLASKGRTYIEGQEITKVFKREPDLIIKYVQDDVEETAKLSALLSRSNFLQAQMLPFSYQNISVRGNATKIDAMLIREYLHRSMAIPIPAKARKYEGGYTDVFIRGVVKNVHHCDIRSLYPSLMLARKIRPASDAADIFLVMLEKLRNVRMEAKRKTLSATNEKEKFHYEAMQAAFKILINSFYGYLGFSQGHFCDFDAAERVTMEGRELLKNMVEWIKKEGGQPVEIDTDGIYFVPPSFTEKEIADFRRRLAMSLPEGIEIEFDGEYESMFSYKMKNYALLSQNGELTIKGAALKSRGLEPFQRKFMEELIRLKLEGKEEEIPHLKARYEKAIANREWHISMFAKTERLQDSLATYKAKILKGRRGRNALYEIAIKSNRDYKAGDQISYYVTGDKKNVTVFGAAKPVSEWDPLKRDENINYYLAKLDVLYKKLTEIKDEESLLEGSEEDAEGG